MMKKSTCSELEEIILKYAKEKSVSLVTEVFYSGDTLLDYLKREKINILFLDIELPGKDGVMVGKYIREVLEEENIFLIYISSKENYALQLFQNRPFDFLVKPIEAAKIYHFWIIFIVYREKIVWDLSSKLKIVHIAFRIKIFCIFKVLEEKLIL